jgi:hypothetical protein
LKGNISALKCAIKEAVMPALCFADSNLQFGFENRKLNYWRRKNDEEGCIRRSLSGLMMT